MSQDTVFIKSALPPAGSIGSSKQKPFIVSPIYDSVFFIFSPLLALSLGIWISYTVLANEKYVLYGRNESLASVFSGCFTMAHLVIVFFRSHANPLIFRQYPNRFIWAPLLLFVSMMLSSWFLVFIFVVAVWWDVYHSSLQTFGLGRIYDLRQGNNPQIGRKLDIGINLLFYIGPIFAGVTLADHVIHFEKFRDVGSAFFDVIPVYAQNHQKVFAWAIFILGIPYLFYYVFSYWKLARQGYAISPQKVFLLVSTGICSIFTWGFNSFGQAFFIMNFFHALQYFALIWWSEGSQITGCFRLSRFGWGRLVALMLFLIIAFSYGIWAKIWGESSHLAFSILLVVSIMHFWYDGFIWSVTRKQIV